MFSCLKLMETTRVNYVSGNYFRPMNLYVNIKKIIKLVIYFNKQKNTFSYNPRKFSTQRKNNYQRFTTLSDSSDSKLINY